MRRKLFQALDDKCGGLILLVRQIYALMLSQHAEQDGMSPRRVVAPIGVERRGHLSMQLIDLFDGRRMFD